MTPPVTDRPILPPEENIGPYYRLVGAFLLFLLAVLVVGLVVALLIKVPLDPLVVKVMAGLAGMILSGALLIIVRPARFDSFFRMVISALPFTKYGSPAAPGGPDA